MCILVVGSRKNHFIKADYRERYIIEDEHAIPNIDVKNSLYCELTGMYYLWKHGNDEIVGLEHYRTYFWKDGHLLDKFQIESALRIR